jgi:hypothetical protein
MKKYILNKRYEIFFFFSILLTRFEGLEELFWFLDLLSFFTFFSGRFLGQGAKRAKWLSEKFLSILENFFRFFIFSVFLFALFSKITFRCVREILQCFLLTYIFFEGNNEENFYWRSSHPPHHYKESKLQKKKLHSFPSSHSLSIVDEKHERKHTEIHSLISFFLEICFLALALWLVRVCVPGILQSENIRRNRKRRWIVSFFIHLRYEIPQKYASDCSYHYTKCNVLCVIHR